MWAQRMLRLTCDSTYGDVMERALYNGAISGVSLDGKRFFYENPLASVGRHRRQDGFGCSCCPPNIARLLASLGGYIYSTGHQSLAIHLYIAGTAKVQLGEHCHIEISAQTQYPWQSQISYQLRMERPTHFDLKFRVPAWCQNYHVQVNGQAIPTALTHGYGTISRTWHPNDTVVIDLPMTIQRISAHPAVQADQGRVALQRGPLVYCIEDPDHAVSVHRMVLPDQAALTAHWDPSLLSGVTVLEASAKALTEGDWSGQLYRPAPAAYEPAQLRAIPYFAWENRAPGGMAVWLPRV